MANPEVNQINLAGKLFDIELKDGRGFDLAETVPLSGIGGLSGGYADVMRPKSTEKLGIFYVKFNAYGDTSNIWDKMQNVSGSPSTRWWLNTGIKLREPRSGASHIVESACVSFYADSDGWLKYGNTYSEAAIVNTDGYLYLFGWDGRPKSSNVFVTGTLIVKL